MKTNVGSTGTYRVFSLGKNLSTDRFLSNKILWSFGLKVVQLQYKIGFKGPEASNWV